MTTAPPESLHCKNPRCQALLGVRGPRGFTPTNGTIQVARTTRVRCTKCFTEQRVYVPQVQK